MANWYQLLERLPLRRLDLIRLWTTRRSVKSANGPDCSALPSRWSVFSMMQTPYNCTKIRFFLRFESSEAQTLTAWWIEWRVWAPSEVTRLLWMLLERPPCISIVLSMPMLSNITNASPCYIFFGAFICACLYLRGGNRECCDIYRRVGMWAAVCMQTVPFSLSLNSGSDTQGVRTMTGVMAAGMLVSHWVSCWAQRGEASASVCVCVVKPFKGIMMLIW